MEGFIRLDILLSAGEGACRRVISGEDELVGLTGKRGVLLRERHLLKKREGEQFDLKTTGGKEGEPLYYCQGEGEKR